MEKEIDFSGMPPSFIVCWNRDCPLADRCLRRVAVPYLPKDKVHVGSVNLNVVDWQEGKCKMFRAIEQWHCAYGLRAFLDSVPHKHYSYLVTCIRAKLPHYLYYDYLNSRRPIPPHHQELIRRIVERICPGIEIRYERYADVLHWG